METAVNMEIIGTNIIFQVIRRKLAKLETDRCCIFLNPTFFIFRQLYTLRRFGLTHFACLGHSNV